MSSSEQYDLRKLAKDDPSSDFQKPSNFGELESAPFDFTSPPFQHKLKGADFQLENIEKPSNVSSFEILKDYTSRSRKVSGEKIPIPNCTKQPRVEKDQKMSTNARIRMAGQQFIDSYSSKVNENCELSHPFRVSFSGLSDDETKDVELLLTLLISAEKTGQRQFDHASKLIDLCNKLSSSEGNTVERLVYYFSEGIREKINREMGKVTGEGFDNMNMNDLQRALISVDAGVLAFHQKQPLFQVCEFSAMQTIIEHVRGARKVNVIDLEIRSGMQYTVLMQALKSQCGWDIECLKITAVGTRLESKLKDICNCLADFAKSMNIPFSFKIVMVTDLLNFNKDLLELDDDEKIAINSAYFLSTLIVKPDRLDHLMRQIRKINPCITLISEIEANHTSPVFVTRFIEALFFYGALFDSVSDCSADDYLNRKVSESVFYGQPIRNIVAAEGDERTGRHVTISVWRAFFARFGMLEVKLSDASLNEAKLIITNFDSRQSCMLHVDGRCFVVGWKDVPVFSVSAWKFV
ncbi:DELLA protein RGL2-like protein [Tanacetum coccineum]